MVVLDDRLYDWLSHRFVDGHCLVDVFWWMAIRGGSCSKTERHSKSYDAGKASFTDAVAGSHSKFLFNRYILMFLPNGMDTTR